MSNDYADRRKFARLDLALTVSYRVADQLGGDKEQDVVSSDISLGGLRLMTPGPLEHGTKLEIEIFLPTDEKDPIKADGEVVWQSKISATSYETGIVIRGIKDTDKRRFMEFVFDQMAKLVTPP
jgi:c-di-GMP-binding flagellar brake protein YcgR